MKNEQLGGIKQSLFSLNRESEFSLPLTGESEFWHSLTGENKLVLEGPDAIRFFFSFYIDSLSIVKVMETSKLVLNGLRDVIMCI